MPNPLRAKSLNPDGSGSLCNFVPELCVRTVEANGQMIDAHSGSLLVLSFF